MIIHITGGIGSGKSLTAVKSIVEDSNKGILVFTNFGVDVLSKRISIEEIVEFDVRKAEGREYWIDKFSGQTISIYIDEVQNWADSRNAMGKSNQCFTAWLSQVRKMLGSSEDSHLYIISQLRKQIDVRGRDLTHISILCSKCKKGLFRWVNDKGEKVVEDQLIVTNKILIHEHNKLLTAKFVGNDYFKYYDTHEIIG